MERERRSKVLAVIAILIAVVSLGVGFAAYSRELTIDGTATVEASSWEIRFENLGTAQLTGTAVEDTAPTINTNDTNIGDYDVTFKTPGDSVSYSFEIANNGTFDAEITTLTVPTPSCTGSGLQAETDAANVCANLEYKLEYSGSDAATGTAVAQGDALNAGERRYVTLTLTYKDTITAENLPQDDVTIDDLGISILYSQK